jgi:tetratricopeptide (TPR) repeat protein
MGKKQSGRGKYLHIFFACIITATMVMCGCAHVYQRFLARPSFEEANNFFKQGNYKASLSKYEMILKLYPQAGDRALFEMGIVYAFPGNQHKDYQKSLEFFQILLKNYPESGHRQGSELMISLINEITSKDKRIMTQRKLIDSHERQAVTQRKQIETLERQVEELEKKIAQMKEVDMKLKEKRKTFPKR